MVEDSEDDALIELHLIAGSGYKIQYERVETAEEMRAMLKEETWDIILSDYSMPYFNGLEALAILKESGIDIPFIIISGTIGEELAVKAMKAGAHDYIMKNNLKRLLPVIERELLESRSRAEKKMLDESARKLTELVATKDKFFSIITHDLQGPFAAMLRISENHYKCIF